MNSIIHNDKKSGQDKKVGPFDSRRRNKVKTRQCVLLLSLKSTKLNHTRSTIVTCLQVQDAAGVAVYCKDEMMANVLCPSAKASSTLSRPPLWSFFSWRDSNVRSSVDTLSRQYFLKYFFYSDDERPSFVH
jgi:hypothetical protein